MKRFKLLVATVVICAALASMTSTVQAQGLFDKLRNAAESMEQISRTLQDITGATGGQTAREEEPEPVTEPRAEAKDEPEPVTERRTEAKDEPKHTGPLQTRQEWKDIQARLNELGYNAGSVDGIPGRGTRSAIAAFETANDLDSDGNADSVMLQALFSRDARAMPRVASEPSEPVTKPTKGSVDTSTAENASSPRTATGTTGVTEDAIPNRVRLQIDCEKWNTFKFFKTATPADVQHCLDAGANINESDAARFTPLHNAATGGTAEVVTTLIHAGANIEALALGANNLPYEWTPLHHAAFGNNADVVIALIEGGANIEAKTVDGSTSLHLAALRNNADVVTTLIDSGANIEAKTVDGSTSLHLAALRNNADVVTTLIDSGATIEAKNRHGRTPLHFAARRNTAEVVTVLLDAGANVKVQDNEGMTALEFAEKHNSALKGTEGVNLVWR